MVTILPPKTNPLASLLLGGLKGTGDVLDQRRAQRDKLELIDRQNEIRGQKSLADQFAKDNAPVTIKDISDYFTKGKFSAEDIEIYGGLPGMQAISQRATQLVPQLGREAAILQAIQEHGQQGQEDPQQQDQGGLWQALMGGGGQGQGQEQQGSFFDPLKQGVQGTAIGRARAIAAGVPYDQYQQMLEIKNPSLLNTLLYGAGNLSGDLPLYGAGAAGGAALGSPGGPIGSALGGSAGAMALPATVNTALEEFHKYQSSGGEMGFEDFVRSVNKTVQEGAKGAAEGVIFGSVSKLMPQLKKMKSLAPLFEKKGAETIAETTLQTGALTGARGLSEGRVPTQGEVVETFTQLLGLNMFNNIPKKTATDLINRVRGSKVAPEQVAKDVSTYMEQNKLDPSKSKDVIRAVQDVTKSYQGPEKQAAFGVLESIKNVESPKPKETAQKLAERPSLKENIEKDTKAREKKDKPLTERETAKRDKASEDAKELQPQIDKVQDELNALNKAAEKAKSEKQAKTFQNAAELKSNELKDLKEKHTDLRSIAEKGVEPYKPEKVKEDVAKHMDELSKVAKDPDSLTAKEWKGMFDRDQKYVNEFMKILQKGELPEAPYRDRYIKTLDLYEDAYKNQIKSVNDLIEAKKKQRQDANPRTKAGREIGNEIAELENLKKLTEKNSDINRAKVGRQKEKIAQIYELKKPGKALVKQELKKLRPDIKELQKDFIKQKEKLEAIEKKAEEVTKPKIERLGKSLEEYRKNPNERALKQLSEEYNVPLEDLKEAKKVGKEAADKVVEMAKDGKSEKEVKSFINKLPERFKKVGKKLGWGALAVVASVELQNGLEKTTGVKIPVATITSLLAGVFGGATGFFSTMGLSSLYKDIRKDFFLSSKKREYKNLKTPDSKSKFLKEMRKEGYSPSDVKEIMS